MFTDETDEESHRYAAGLVKALTPYDDDDFKIADFIDELAKVETKRDVRRMVANWERKEKA